jgi:ketosteroid isomerase-like protein
LRTPEETVRAVAVGVCRLMRGGLTAAQEAEQIGDLAACYAERTDVRHPFHPLGDTPLRTRAEVRDHFAAGGPPANVERYDVIDDKVYRTPDPEVVIFEFRYAGVVAGRAFTLPCIFVVRVRNGEIVESRDYADHIAGARAFGHLPALSAALSSGTGETRIRQLAREFQEAEAGADLAALDALLADDFRSIGEQGFVLDKAQWLGKFAELAYAALESSDVEVSIYGHTAIVRCVQRSRAVWRGQEMALTTRVGQTWVELPAGWRLAGIQFSSLTTA